MVVLSIAPADSDIGRILRTYRMLDVYTRRSETPRQRKQRENDAARWNRRQARLGRTTA